MGHELLIPTKLIFILKPFTQQYCRAPDFFFIPRAKLRQEVPFIGNAVTGNIKNKSTGTKIPSLWRFSLETAVGCHADCLRVHISCDRKLKENPRETLQTSLP